MNNEEIPTELTKNMPVEEALKLTGFTGRSDYGNLKRTWGPIEVIAGPWIWEWKLLITIKRNSKRTIHVPQELSIGRAMRPIDILVIIYCACDSLFLKEEPPKELMWGKLEWNHYNEELRQELERRPKLWAEKQFFRFCISYLEKRYDWANEDYDIEFSHKDGQLQIKAKNDIIFCPAIGTFNGTLTMSARQLFRRLPKRFVSPTVFIEVIEKDKAIISSHMIPAKWTEKFSSPECPVTKELIGIVPIPQNSEKLNQESKKALLELKQKPDETSLYCLQLAEYSLKNNLEDQDGRLTTTLEEMKGWKPQEVMNFLESNGEEDAVDWKLVNNDPNELADQILIRIGDNLALTLPCYPKNLFKVRI